VGEDYEKTFPPADRNWRMWVKPSLTARFSNSHTQSTFHTAPKAGRPGAVEERLSSKTFSGKEKKTSLIFWLIVGEH
jgi:hypothetical protein